jgi:hypothetical protein
MDGCHYPRAGYDTDVKWGNMAHMATDRDLPWRRIWLLAAAVLLWPAILNGMPFLFYDTPGYLGAANALVHGVIGSPVDWTAAPVMLGRSIYYGLFLYGSLALGSFWPAAIAQALLASACAMMFLRYFLPRGDARIIIAAILIGVLLLGCTTLPFFSTFMMPDLFSGLILLSATALLLFWRQDSRARRSFWFAVTTAAALCHSTNIPILLAMVTLGILFHFLVRLPRPWLAAGSILLAASCGVAGEAIFSAGVKYALDAPPIRPPFVTARLTADGPGTRYLKETCPGNGFILCRYAARLPLPSDHFLWSNSSVDGVFRAAPAVQRRQMAADETRFVLATLRRFPVETMLSFAIGARRQIKQVGLSEFNYGWIERGFFFNHLPRPIFEDVSKTRAFSLSMPAAAFAKTARILAIISLAICLLVVMDRKISSTLRLAIALIICGVIVNAFICGGLSGAHDRYQARVLWLLPWIGYLALLARFMDKTRAKPVATPRGAPVDNIGVNARLANDGLGGAPIC